MFLIIVTVLLIGTIMFLWIQLNSTSSRLVEIIENRIKLNNNHYQLEEVVVIDRENTE